ncbi:SAM-dependent methyltransferase [Gluconacetobacter johannae DSM 13595]|nr:class I SAM-dependent methyltransferase [Gluconacetobacter johannae]GBQ87259.1 SAM-dependent methyltransferase [Gluconacetobacter johannae DSM 13595]
MSSLPLQAGRTAFGGNPDSYEAARPPYPDAVYAALRERCTITGARLFEIGAGTGKATFPLLADRPAQLTAVEPDARLTRHLADLAGNDWPMLDIMATSWEEAVLPDGAYDLGFAATAFHWLPQGEALRKIVRALRPGGWWTMWWNVFGDPDAPDAFHQRAGALFRGLRSSPAWAPGRRPFGLDIDARIADLKQAGFEDPVVDVLRWTIQMDAGQVRALAATFSEVVNAGEHARQKLLDDLTSLVEDEFGGQVERHFVTPMYMARKP